MFQALVVTQRDRLTLKMSALETLHGGSFAGLTHFIKPIYWYILRPVWWPMNFKTLKELILEPIG